MAVYIKLKELLDFPLRRNRCDEKHANPHFINGVETVMEYAEILGEYARCGAWERENEDLPMYKCSVCGGHHLFELDSEELFTFCPFCGVKMIGDGVLNRPLE